MSVSDNEKALLSILADLTAAVSNIRLYSREHPQVRHYLEKAFDDINSALSFQQRACFMAVENQLIIGNRAVTSKGPHLERLVNLLKKNQIEHVSFERGLEKNDFFKFIFDLSALDAVPICSQPFIKLGKVRIKGEAVDSDPVQRHNDSISDPYHKENGRDSGLTGNLLESEIEAIQKLYALAKGNLDSIKELCFNIKRYQTLDIRGLEEMIKAFVKGFSRNLNPLGMLAPLKTSDEYTFTHVVNVCILTMSQAEYLGFTGHNLYNIGVAAALHDVGKLFVPPEIIAKPYALNSSEMDIIKTHTTKGARYIIGLDGVPRLAVLGALEHHFRYDGSGYPTLGAHWKPNIVSQMIAVSDIYDAMRSRRPYKDPRPEAQILAIMEKEKGKSLNPVLVDNFMTMIKPG